MLKINPIIPLRRAKTPKSFGCSECIWVKEKGSLMDGWITYDFTSVSTVLQSYQTWVDDNERLCAMKPHLQLRGY